MGYGGFIKKIVRIAVPIAVSFIPGAGPLAVAISSAAATAATGGSFKEALISGATSYIGSQITQSLSQAANTAAINAGPNVSEFVPQSDFMAGVGDIINAGDATLAAAGDAITGSSLFQAAGDTGFGGFIESGVKTARTAFDTFQRIGGETLGALGLETAGAVAPSLTAGAIGGLTTLTLNQALLLDTPESNQALLDTGFTQNTIELLRNEARNAQSQTAFEGLLETVDNPFLRGGQDADQLQAAQDEFAKVLAAGVERENVRLGPEVTQQQFSDVFDQPDLGSTILRSEEDLRKQAFNQQIGQTFPGDVFQSLDDDIISSIVGERQGPAQEQISRFGARGNLNPTGGKTANLFIQEQVPGARERVTELGSGVLGQNIRDIGDIRSQASEQVNRFQLGDEPFDVAPFAEQRRGLVEERQGTLGSDVRSAVGGEPLFDVSGALQAGGRAQGVVSGQGQNQAFLDQIASRELGSTGSLRNRRGLGSRGSGAF